MSRQSFRQVLLSFGFKRLKSHRDGVASYHREDMGWYCEVYLPEDYAWATGGNLRSQTAYPGGYAYHEPEDLREELEAKTGQQS